MSAFSIFNNNVNAPAVSVKYFNEKGVSVTTSVGKNVRKPTDGILLKSKVTVRWGQHPEQTIEHKEENERVLEITHGVGNYLGLNWKDE